MRLYLINLQDTDKVSAVVGKVWLRAWQSTNGSKVRLNRTYSRSTVKHSTPGGNAMTLAVRRSSLQHITVTHAYHRVSFRAALEIQWNAARSEDFKVMLVLEVWRRFQVTSLWSVDLLFMKFGNKSKLSLQFSHSMNNTRLIDASSHKFCITLSYISRQTPTTVQRQLTSATVTPNHSVALVEKILAMKGAMAMLMRFRRFS